MPSRYSHLTIPLGLGLQTDVDDKLLPVNKTAALENIGWNRDGELVKRPGSTLLGSQYAAATPGTMPAAWQLATHKGALVTLSKAGPRPIGVYSSALNKWIAPPGSTNTDNSNGVVSKLRGAVTARRSPTYRSNASGATTTIFATDQATDGTYQLVCWVDSITAANAVFRAYGVELATGKILFTYSRAATTINGVCRAVLVNGEFRLVFIDGVNVKYVSWTISNIAAGTFLESGEFSLATDASVFYLDVIAQGTDMLVLYDGATTRIVKKDSGGVTTASNLTSQGGGAIAIGHHAWLRDLSGSGKVAAVCSSASQGVRVHWDINTSAGTTALSYTIDGAAGLQDQVTGHTISSNSTGEFVVLYHLGASPASILWGRRQTGAITTQTWIIRAALASQPWIHGTEFYQCIAYESDEQGTYFVNRVPTNTIGNVDDSRTPSARFASAEAPNQFVAVPPSVTAMSTDVFRTAMAIKTNFVQQAGFATTYDTGVDAVKFTYNPSDVGGSREFADNLFVCGGLLAAFDGQCYSEEGFNVFPEGLSLSQSAGGSLTVTGNYVYQAVYRYTDEFGRIRRSRPSDPVSIALTGANATVTVGIRTLKLHGHFKVLLGAVLSNVVIELYRNVNNSTAMKLVAVVANNEAADTVSVVDTQSDGSVSAGRLLYTDGGKAAFGPPPQPLAIANYKDRMAVIDAEDPTLIWVSYPLLETEGPQFNALSSLRIDDGRGDLTGLAVVDDRLIAFKQSAVYAVVGDGPDVLGNGSFGLAQIIASGIGCSQARSISSDADGVGFRSTSTRDGYFRVNRGLAIEEYGGDVQTYLQRFDGSNLSETIADVVNIPELQKTKIFTVTAGKTLVYDASTKHWSVDTNQNALAAVNWNGASAYQTNSSNLSIVLEDTSGTVFDDSSSPVEMYAETPWISLADLKGYERFRKVQLVGEKRVIPDTGDHGYIVDIKLMANFDDSTIIAEQTKAMLDTDDINAIELRYSSKFSAIKVGVRIKQSDAANFAGPTLTAVVIEYLAKQGVRPVVSTNRTT